MLRRLQATILNYPTLSRILIPAFFSFVGFVANPLLSIYTSKMITPENLLLLLFFVFAGFGVLGLLYYQNLHNIISSLNNNVTKIARVVDQDARLVPFQQAYKELAKWVENAENEVLILTYTPYKWMQEASGRVNSPERVAWFETAEKVIRSEKVFFHRILQIEIDKDTTNATQDELKAGYDYLNAEPMNTKMAFALCEIQDKNPTKAQLQFSRVCFRNTFVLVDKKKLFLNFDFFIPSKRKFESQTVLLAEDATGEAFKELVINFTNISRYSKTITDKSQFSKKISGSV